MRLLLKTVLLFSLLAETIVMHAQVQLQFKSKPLINFSSEDAVDIIIYSVLDESVNVILKVQIMTDGSKRLVEYQTGEFVIQPGMNLLDKNELAIKNKRYYNMDLGNYEMVNGFLPSGTYNYCVSLVCVDETCFMNIPYLFEREIQICQETNTVSPTPLLLASPADESKLKFLRPDFNWIPPMPVGLDPNINYQFKLVEMRENQSGESAIKRNVPIYRDMGIQAIALSYPPEIPDLTVGKKYAWQVEGFLGNTFIQASEVWEFEIIAEEEKIFPMPYVKLRLEDGSIYNAVNLLKFIFYRESYEKKLNYEILTIEGVNLMLNLPNLNTVLGENQFEIDLTNLGLEHKKYYILRVYGENQSIYNLKFRYYLKRELK